MSGAAAPPVDQPDESFLSMQLDEVMRELRELHAMMSRKPVAGDGAGPMHPRAEQTRQQLAALRDASHGETEWTVMARELGVVVEAARQASEQILTAAEEIDQAANTLSASTRTEHEQGLAQDIRDQVIRIYEACNFHDLGSQRVAKVLGLLSRIEAQVARLADIWDEAGAPPAPAAKAAARRAGATKRRKVRGTAAPGDSDRLTQAEIDAMFD